MRFGVHWVCGVGPVALCALDGRSGSRRFAAQGADAFVDLVACRARMRLLAEPLLLHANEQAHAAGAAAHRAGRLDTLRLAGAGRDRYPPLLPLKTLPNMALAHASIHLDIGGENGAWAGGPEAGLMALREGMYAVLEGRAPAALVGGADSQVALGSARDRLRMGHRGPPGEAGSAVLLEPFEGEPSSATLAVLSLSGCGPVRSLSAHHAGLGDCGAADGVLALVLVAAALSPGEEVQLGGIGVRAPELAVGPC